MPNPNTTDAELQRTVDAMEFAYKAGFEAGRLGDGDGLLTHWTRWLMGKQVDAQH